MRRNLKRLPFGKVPPELLESHVFPYLGSKRGDIILGPSRGEDAALVETDNVLVASSCDPISGATNWIGRLAVHISANDVSTLGVEPRWFHSCILLPENCDPEDLKKISLQIHEASDELNVAVVGGHSEVTPSLKNPIIVGFCMGVAKDGRYITSSGAKAGGKIILTKGVALEGTAIICADKAEIVEELLGESVQKRGVEYIRSISVVREALAAFNWGGVQAMHDPTEGGLAGGLHEIGDASKRGFIIYEDKIVIKPETRMICDAFQIDPLKLISSGALIIVSDRDKAHSLIQFLGSIGIEASSIGEIVQEENHRTIIRSNGEEEDLFRPDTDELWKALLKDIHDLRSRP